MIELGKYFVRDQEWEASGIPKRREGACDDLG